MNDKKADKIQSLRFIIHSSIAFKVLAYVLYFYVPNPNIIFLSRCLAGIAYGADGSVVGQVSRLDENFKAFMQNLIIIMRSE